MGWMRDIVLEAFLSGAVYIEPQSLQSTSRPFQYIDVVLPVDEFPL